MHNAFAQAFINVGLVNADDKRGRFKQGWNAKLSYRTYTQLKAQGYVE